MASVTFQWKTKTAKDENGVVNGNTNRKIKAAKDKICVVSRNAHRKPKTAKDENNGVVSGQSRGKAKAAEDANDNSVVSGKTKSVKTKICL